MGAALLQGGAEVPGGLIPAHVPRGWQHTGSMAGGGSGSVAGSVASGPAQVPLADPGEAEVAVMVVPEAVAHGVDLGTVLPAPAPIIRAVRLPRCPETAGAE